MWGKGHLENAPTLSQAAWVGWKEEFILRPRHTSMAQPVPPAAEGTEDNMTALSPSTWNVPGNPVCKPSDGLRMDSCHQAHKPAHLYNVMEECVCVGEPMHPIRVNQD